MKVQTTADLRRMLIDTIDQVRTGKIDPRQANAISSLSSKVIQSARLDLEAIRLSQDHDLKPGKEVLQLVSMK